MGHIYNFGYYQRNIYKVDLKNLCLVSQTLKSSNNPKNLKKKCSTTSTKSSNPANNSSETLSDSSDDVPNPIKKNFKKSLLPLLSVSLSWDLLVSLSSWY